ncbi:MAG: hypothetical protein GY913_30530, partial [Proteobacteria bacterium]|nr:hypothetical protein [Pseudomonadota bacterium]
MGGVGKTHLALELGREANERGEAAWVCELAEARDAEGLRAAVGRAMGLGGDGDIGAALAGRGRCLLILDHLEHVVGPSTE